MSQRRLFTSESVSEGHPDKVCDQVSDAVLDTLLEQDPMSRVACETLATTGIVFIAGEITTEGYADLQEIARTTLNKIGYNDPQKGIDCNSCAVINCLDKQSPDIARGVDSTPDHEQGAGDQGMMFGYACRETKELMPMPIQLAHRLVARLADLRRDGTLPYLRPDAKSQVTVEYEGSKVVGIDTVVISTQHDESICENDGKGEMNDSIKDEIIEKVIRPVLPAEYVGDNLGYHINPTGRFVIGGPHGDCGLTGRKIICDTYGGAGRHGGGAFSGKDATKVDRSAAYAARWVAKNIVAAELADRCELQVAYAIGVSHPVSIAVDTFGTGKIDDLRITELVKELFDLRPGAIIERLQLRRPIFSATAAYGHFGRELDNFTWEKTDMAEALKNKA